MERKNITIMRGDTLSFSAKFRDLEDDLTAAAITCRKTPDDSNVIFQETLVTGGITKVDTGVYSVRVPPADTANVEPGRYHYDFEVQLGGDVYTLLYGTLELMQDVTR